MKKGYHEMIAYHTNPEWARMQKMHQPTVMGFYRGGAHGIHLVYGGRVYMEHCLRGIWMFVGCAELWDPVTHSYETWAEVWREWGVAAGATSLKRLEEQGTRQLGWAPGKVIEVLGLSRQTWLWGTEFFPSAGIYYSEPKRGEQTPFHVLHHDPEERYADALTRSEIARMKKGA